VAEGNRHAVPSAHRNPLQATLCWPDSGKTSEELECESGLGCNALRNVCQRGSNGQV
jgi:hypothetical protein